MAIEIGSMLVVDDDKMSRMLLARNLQQVGHSVVTAENGSQALELMRTQSFDIILLDCLMP
ncbi:MAG: response regulator, partial [Desulfobacterales bacterium]|nr:response regulator [Desulfobacterales bacterium]